MLGWMISVYDHITSDPRDHRRLDKERCVAQWQASLGGVRWMDGMVERSEALLFSSVGYPEIYVTSALNIKNALRFGIPKGKSPPVIGIDPGDEYYLPANWVGDKRLNMERLQAIPDARLMTVEAWDLS